MRLKILYGKQSITYNKEEEKKTCAKTNIEMKKHLFGVEKSGI